MSDRYVMIDVYRDDFFLRRETLGDLPRAVEIGSDPRCRLWLDSSRVEPVAARLLIEEDGTVRLPGSGQTVGVGWSLRIDPFVLVLAKGATDPEPGAAERLLASVRAQFPQPPEPDPAPVAQACPRCGTKLVADEMPAPSGYRSAPVTALACGACRLLVVPPGVFADAALLADSAATRRRVSAAGLCPHCRSDMQGLVLSWGDDWLSIEVCRACGATVVDRSEIAALARIGAAVRGT